MNIQPSQQRFLDSTLQDFENVIIGIPVLPLKEFWGNIFAEDPRLKRGGHMIVTNCRLIFCPKDNPGSWVWHFNELQGLSIQSSLLKSIITLSMDGVDLRWQTLRKGANELANSWNSWRQFGSAFARYPSFKVNHPNSGENIKCKKCGLSLNIEIEDTAKLQKHCGACYSLHEWHD